MCFAIGAKSYNEDMICQDIFGKIGTSDICRERFHRSIQWHFLLAYHPFSAPLVRD